MTSFLYDLRAATRALGRSRGYFLAAVATLALGVGATAALFGVVNAVLLRPLPYREPDRLVRVWPEGATPKSVFAAFQARARSYAALAGYQDAQAASVRAGDEPARVAIAAVTGGLFQTLGVSAAVGRALAPADAAPGGEPVAVLSDKFWRERFAGRPAAVGQYVDVDGVRHRVLGVMPPTFRLPSSDVAVWVPARVDPAQFADYWWVWRLHVVARLAPGVTAAQARAEARTIVERARGEFPMRLPDDWGKTMDVVGMRDATVGGTRATLFLLLGAVGVVLAVAVVNATGLALVRATGREREVVVRAALGAGRARLARLLLAEGVVVAGLATVGGALVAAALTEGITRYLPRTVPRGEEIALDGRALAVAALVALVGSTLAALAPAVAAARADVRGTLAAGTRAIGSGRPRRRLMDALVVAQVAFGVVLAVGAATLALGLARLGATDPGFRADRVTVAEVPLPAVSGDSAARGRAFYDALVARARALPGVRAAAVASGVPFDERGIGFGPLDVEANPIAPGADRPSLAMVNASPGYFETLGIPLVAGRDFAESDRAGAPDVVVVDAEAARVFWPGRRDVVGQRVKYVYLDTWMTVVGVVGGVRRDSLSAAPTPTMYRPAAQGFVSDMRLVTRGDADAAALAPALRSAVRELEPTVPLGAVRPLGDLVSESAARPRFVTTLLAGFAAVAVLLGAVGVYGVAAFAVARRTREIGVRVALGASPGTIRGFVLREGARLAAVGLVLGAAGALAAGRVAGAAVSGFARVDPLILPPVLAALALVALLANALPARRAARVSPVEAIKSE